MKLQFVILAAGEGTRLRPITAQVPKCMVPLAGVPLLERQLRTIRHFTEQPPVVVAGHRASALTHSTGVDIVENPRYGETNMVESLLVARSHLAMDRDLVISYGDIVYGPHVLQAVLDNPEDVVIAIDDDWERLWSVRMEDPFEDAESMQIKDGFVVQLGDPRPAPQNVQGQYIGLTRIKKQVLGRWWDFVLGIDAEVQDKMYMTELLQAWIDSGEAVGAARFAGGWLEVDTLDDLEAYEGRPDLIAATEDK